MTIHSNVTLRAKAWSRVQREVFPDGQHGWGFHRSALFAALVREGMRDRTPEEITKHVDQMLTRAKAKGEITYEPSRRQWLFTDRKEILDFIAYSQHQEAVVAATFRSHRRAQKNGDTSI